MDLQGQLAIDGRSLDQLKQAAAKDPQAAVRQAATQFEAMFTQMLLKSMRDAMPKSGLFSSSTEDLATSMLDQQLSQKVGNRPGGLADIIARQLSQRMGASTASGDAIKLAPLSVNQPAPTDVGAMGNQQKAAIAAAAAAQLQKEYRSAAGAGQIEQAGFVRKMWSHAEQAQRATGVRAEFVVGQAALESGWGAREIRHADGRSAHNLFGIKAGAGWSGPVAEVTTTEYVGGVARKQVEKFRAYGSYAEAFTDWSRLMAGKARYGDVLKQGGAQEAMSVQGYAQSMQRSGYATDPRYGEKLEQTIQRTIALRRLMV
jgi:peptidoglycan hydrolase FlgJ